MNVDTTSVTVAPSHDSSAPADRSRSASSSLIGDGRGDVSCDRGASVTHEVIASTISRGTVAYSAGSSRHCSLPSMARRDHTASKFREAFAQRAERRTIGSFDKEHRGRRALVELFEVEQGEVAHRGPVEHDPAKGDRAVRLGTQPRRLDLQSEHPQLACIAPTGHHRRPHAQPRGPGRTRLEQSQRRAESQPDDDDVVVPEAAKFVDTGEDAPAPRGEALRVPLVTGRVAGRVVVEPERSPTTPTQRLGERAHRPMRRCVLVAERG